LSDYEGAYLWSFKTSKGVFESLGSIDYIKHILKSGASFTLKQGFTNVSCK
jgi:hypothetical protein